MYIDELGIEVGMEPLLHIYLILVERYYPTSYVETESSSSLAML